MRIVLEMDDADLTRLGAAIAAGMPSTQTPSQINSGLPLLLTVRRAAEVLSISRGQCYELVACGRLPSARVGSSVRVLATGLNDFLVGLEA